MANTLKFGAGEWATKEGSALAYNDENGNFKPLPFDFTRASNATRVGRNGLIETVGSNVPRIDFLNDSNGALKLEPQRSNELLYSEEFNNAAWSKTNSTITANDAVSPDGLTNADKITDNANSTQHRVTQAISVTSGTSYNASIFVKNDDKGDFAINFTAAGFGSTQIVFNLINGTVTSGTGTIEDYGNGWYRISATAAANVTGRGTIGFNLGDGGGYVGTGQSVFIWGAQVEEGSYETSYIPTQGSQVTRVADACSQTPPDGIIGQTEGTLFAEIDYTINTESAGILGIDGGSVNFAFLFIGASNAVNFNIYYGGSPQALLAYTLPSSGKYKIAGAYKENDFVLYVNGVQRASDTSGIVPTCSVLSINSTSYGLPPNSKHSQAQLYNTRLSNAELQALTTI